MPSSGSPRVRALQKGEITMAKHNVYVGAERLNNKIGSAGRLNYITSPKKQENLLAVYYSQGKKDMKWWNDYMEHCDEVAKYNGVKNGEKVETIYGRDFVVDAANELLKLYTPLQTAKLISDWFKKETGCENVVAGHLNKTRTDYHFHVVTAEAVEINEIKYGAVECRNRYYNAQGKQDTKKNCVDPITKELLPGCELVKKGEKRKIVKRWSEKKNLGSVEFSNKVKEWWAETQNSLLDTDKYQVYKDDGIHIKTQHVGKKVTGKKKIAIEEKNKSIREYNKAVDEYISVSTQVSKEDGEAAIEECKEMRNNIKEFSYNYSSWLSMIRENLKILKEWIEEAKQELKEMFKKPEIESGTRTSVRDRIKSIKKERENTIKGTVEPFQKKKSINGPVR